jgi:hypothetical protein
VSTVQLVQVKSCSIQLTTNFLSGTSINNLSRTLGVEVARETVQALFNQGFIIPSPEY